jgi:hypothetical protein
MASYNQMKDCLQEHLPYELRMLKFAGARLQDTRGDRFNAFFECFVVHARSLYEFVTNTGDSRSFMAKDFGVKRKIPQARRDLVHGTIKTLNQHVFHIGKRRPREIEKKVSSGQLKEVQSWIEEEMQAFVAALSMDLGALWNHQVSELSANVPDATPHGATLPASPPTATNNPQSTTSGATGTAYLVERPDQDGDRG